jgi:hypothetical protein
MPVADKKDAKDLDEAFDALIAASAAQRAQRLRTIFIEKLDFVAVTGAASLKLPAFKLRVDGNDVDGPTEAVRIANRDGVHVLWVQLPDAKLRARNARAVLKAIEDSRLGGQHLLVLSVPEGNLWHLIWSPDPGPRRVLRRMAIKQGVPRRTIVMQLAGVSFDVKAGLRKAIDDAFDVEPVTKEFFKTYRDVFQKVMGMIKGVPSEESRRLFCQTLFNRLMFIYFLQQKKWLSLRGDTNYLRALHADFKKNKSKGEKFYDDRLKHLFFTMLNSPNSLDLSKSLKETFGDVPFLNGGLFEETDLDKECAKASVPDEAFDLIFDSLFERFNFTVSESTPYDIEVAVDPEMLGKVFEELVTGRHETGSYYTPRPVVSFMCREALKGYLGADLKAVPSEAIAKLVDEHDVSDINLTHAAAIVQALDRITVVDPACGSGAYLLGMLHELIELKQELFSQRLQRDPDQLYKMKLDVIERNIYGVDIDEFATNIAMLRLWLSLSIEFDGKRPKPLPNLDFKILCGDSLTAPNPSVASDMFRKAVHDAADEFAALKAEYMMQSGHEKGATRRRVIAAEKDLERSIASLGGAAPKGAVDWRVDFAEVFQRSGFNVVLANPPYVRADAQFKHLKPDEKARKAAVEQWQEYRKNLAASKVYKTLYERWDVYIPFLERALQLLAPAGQMVFIIPDAFNAAKYAEKAQAFFLTESRLTRVDFCSDIPLFEAGVRNTILHFENSPSPPTHHPVKARRHGTSPSEFEVNCDLLPTGSQKDLGRGVFRPMTPSVGVFAAETVPLGDIFYISYGLRANSDDRYWPAEFVTADLVSNKRDKKHSKPFFEGKDVSRWRIEKTRYLEWGTSRAPAKFARPTFVELHEASEKLVALVVAGRAPVAFDNQQRFTTHTSCLFVPWVALKGVDNRSIRKSAYYGRPSLAGDPAREEREKLSQSFSIKYVLALLNSSACSRWISSVQRSKMHVYPDDWKKLPIPVLSSGDQQPFVDLVDEILGLLDAETAGSEATNRRVIELEKALDGMASQAYAEASPA